MAERIIDTGSSATKAETVEKCIVFGGTTEGRLLADGLADAGKKVTLCVATEYGEEVLDAPERFDLRCGGLDAEGIYALIREIEPDAIYDATHPYAAAITALVYAAAAESGKRYIRIRRQLSENEGTQESGMNTDRRLIKMQEENRLVFVPDLEAAVKKLEQNEQRAFISTGSRGAEAFGQLNNAAERLTLRILPSEDAVRMCREAGFSGRNLICMQGPFSTEMNEAMFRATDSRILVTKYSGKTGGFPEKLEAADRLGMNVMIISPPEDMPGISVEEALTPHRERIHFRSR